jgi:hypothetical protein
LHATCTGQTYSPPAEKLLLSSLATIPRPCMTRPPPAHRAVAFTNEHRCHAIGANTATAIPHDRQARPKREPITGRPLHPERWVASSPGTDGMLWNVGHRSVTDGAGFRKAGRTGSRQPQPARMCNPYRGWRTWARPSTGSTSPWRQHRWSPNPPCLARGSDLTAACDPDRSFGSDQQGGRVPRHQHGPHTFPDRLNSPRGASAPAAAANARGFRYG